jgi:catechol 2,3-dioxygenase-like lactoylglutathione lyase family enzyme
MLHHLSFGVADIHRSARFYDAVLGAFGFERVFEDLEGADAAVGYGLVAGEDKFCIKQRPGVPIAPPPGLHLAFEAPDRAAVDRFHAEALAHGGRDNGAPGLRPHYGPHYYAAFVVDPDGYRIEAVITRAAG